MAEISTQAAIKRGLMVKYALCACSVCINCYLNNSKMTIAKCLASKPQGRQILLSLVT
jgi:hypothetical protein